MQITQAEYWNGQGGETWVREQELIDRSLEPMTLEHWLPWVAPGGNERVLDVGCGTGTTTILMRDRAASAAGVDVSGPMLAHARTRAPGTDFTEADAATHAFDPVHDLLVSRFGVMFFEDPVAAFTNLRGALAPDGRIAFMCWRAPAENPWASRPVALATELGAQLPMPDPHAPGPFAFADRGRLAAILTDAGYREIVIEPRDSVMPLGESVEAAVASSMAFGPAARLAADFDAATREQLRSRLHDLYTQRGTSPSAAVWLVRAV